MSSRIFVVTHLEPSYQLPAGYSYIGVGAKGFHTEYRDDDGTNIADKNPYYCELTALYWIWKNYQCSNDDIVGLVHYRRVLSKNSIFNFLFKSALSLNEINHVLNKQDVILPLPVSLEGGIFEQYSSAHNIDDLNLCVQEILDSGKIDFCDLTAFKKLNAASIYNMMVCRKSVLDSYCEWLFPILFSIEPRLDLLHRSSYQKRAIGFLAERLLNLWLTANQDYKLAHFPVLRLDKSGFSNLNRLRKRAV